MEPGTINDENSAIFNHFESILETISQEIVVFDADGKFVYGNSASKRNGNLTSLQAQTSPDGTYHDVEFRDVNGEIIPPHAYPSVMARKGVTTQGNIFQFIQKKTGKFFWYETNAVPLFDGQGNVSYFIISYRDVTAKKSQEEKLNFLVDAFKILSRTLDFNVLLHRISKLMVPTLADWSAIDIVNKDGVLERITMAHQDPDMIALVHEIDKLFPPDPKAVTGSYHVVKTGQSEFIPKITDEMVARGAKNETTLQLLRRLNLSSVITVPIAARGRVLGALSLVYAESGRTYTQADLEFAADFCNHIGILLDNAKLYQEIESENQNKEQFLAVLSHELRNPLAPIANSLELLGLKDIKNPEITEELKVINRQFKYMEKLLKDLLEVSRLTTGTISLEKIPFDLVAVIKESIESVQSAGSRMEHTIHTTLPDHPVEIFGDPVRITQVIINLLDNAIKFTPPGGTIWITLTDDEKRAHITVKDNGVGIKPRLLPHIFDLYTKGFRQSLDKLNSGLGIGLVLVKKLLELHGATIVAKSDGIDQGTEFIINIPLYATQEDDTSSLPSKDKTDKEIFGRIRVLLVDDNQDAANALVKLFEIMGAQAHAVYSSAEVLAVVEKVKPNVIILDIGMPEMDGYEIARALRNNKFKKTMIALTGYGQKVDKQRAKDAGFDHHLTKPSRLADFKEIFLEVIDET